MLVHILVVLTALQRSWIKPVFFNTIIPSPNSTLLAQSLPLMALSKLMGCRFNPVVPAPEKRGRKTLVDQVNSKLAKRAKLINDRRGKMPHVEEINCCHKNCIGKAIPSLEKRSQLRDEYFSCKSDCDRKQWLTDTFLFDFDDADDVEVKVFHYMERKLCWSAIKRLTGCSNNLLAAVKGTNLARASSMTFRPARTGHGAHRTKDGIESTFLKREHIAAWLTDQRNFYCMQPDRDEVLMPFAFKREVYQSYCAGQIKESFDVSGDWLKCTEQYFNRVWKLDVPTLKCRKFHRFQMCDVCCALNDKLRIKSLSDHDRKIYAKAKEEHLRVVREDRYGYEMRILQSKEYSEELMNITIDGSDNGQYGFPYWAIKTKETDKGYKLKAKLYAALVHGHGVYAYLFNAHLEGGTNVTVNVLHQTLTKLQAEGKKFPPILCLQLDNTVKENKSRYVMAYLQALVDCGLFQEINVFFFQVGHTHCDIDQLFSRVSIYLKDKHVFTFEDLCRAVKQALGGWSYAKHAEKMDYFANWRDAIKPYLVDFSKFTGITRF